MQMMLKLAKEMTTTLKDAGYTFSISETHHVSKLDAPSGTALTLRDAVLHTLGATDAGQNPASPSPPTAPATSKASTPSSPPAPATASSSPTNPSPAAPSPKEPSAPPNGSPPTPASTTSTKSSPSSKTFVTELSVGSLVTHGTRPP